MISNLNQVNFRQFGTILPEQTARNRRGQQEHRERLSLKPGEAPVYLAGADTWLCSGEGMTVLSVSNDNETYSHFYLDKPVFIRAGVYFSLAPLVDAAWADYSAADTPRQVGTRNQREGFDLRNHLRVERLYTFFYQEKERGFVFAGESHPALELTYVDQGSLHSVADGQDLLLEQGDMVLYGPGQWHMQYSDIGVAPRFVTVSFDISGADLSGLTNRKFQSPQRAATILKQMLQEQDRMDDYSNDMILCLLNLLLLTLQREAGGPTERLKTSHALHTENEIIRKAQQYISAHVREKLSVPMVAKNVDVSPSYLTALFHKNLQISPGEYIRRVKLQESKQMIRENNMNFTEIAAALQYSTVHHFSRQFKEKFGITPTEYAKSVR